MDPDVIRMREALVILDQKYDVPQSNSATSPFTAFATDPTLMQAMIRPMGFAAPQESVTFIIGPRDSEIKFEVPKAIVCHCSTVLAEALNSDAVEARTLTIRLPLEEPNVWRRISHWMNTQEIEGGYGIGMTNAMILWERGGLYNIPELQNNAVAIVRTLALTTKRVRDLWSLALFAYREPNIPRKQVLQRLAADRFSMMPYWTRHSFIDRLRTMASAEVFLAIDTAVNSNLRQETSETRTLGPLMRMVPVQKYYVDVPRAQVLDSENRGYEDRYILPKLSQWLEGD